MISNKARVGRALYLLKIDLDTFVPAQFLNHHQDGAGSALDQILGQTRDPEQPFHNMKAQDLLTVVLASWWEIFDRALGGVEPSLVRGVAMAHDAWASRQDFSPDSAYQALTAIQRLLAAMSSPSTLELDMLLRESLESAAEAAEEAVTVLPEEVSQAEAVTGVGVGADTRIDTEQDKVVEAAADDSVASQPEPEEVEEPAQADTEVEPYLRDLLGVLHEAGVLQPEDFSAKASRAGKEPEYGDDSVIPELDPALAQALNDAGVERLFAHQEAVISQSLSGADLVLQAGWAADEALTWAVPLAETLLRNPGSHALILCPDPQAATAISARLDGLLSAAGINIVTWPDDSGDVGLPDSEPMTATALVTTPERINRSLADSGEGWQAFLGNVLFVAIDGAEEYRGQFGANVAITLRRLAHRLAILGANPQTLVVTRGCGNAAELAETLTGKTFQTVSALDAPSPRRHYVFIDPQESGPSQPPDLADRLGRAALAGARWGKSVMVCCPNEEMARQSFVQASELAETEGAEDVAMSLLLDVGTNSASIDDGETRQGRATFTTAFLAATLLPGDFDGIILAGCPDSLRTARQLTESTGRNGAEDAFALFYADGKPESRFVAHNLDAFLARTPDQIVLDPDMAEIIRPHLDALYRESKGRVYSFSQDILGNPVFQALRREAAQLASDAESPAAPVSLASVDDEEWTLWHDGEQVGSMAPYRKFREIYQGSVLVLNGVKYRVARVDAGDESGGPPQVVLETSEALANLRTLPQFQAAVSVRDESLRLSPAPGISLHLGIVAAEESLVQVAVIDESELATVLGDGADSSEIQDIVTATFAPEQESLWSKEAPAFWLNVEGLLADNGQAISPPALNAVAEMLRVGVRFTFPVDKYDLAIYSDASSIYLVEVGPQAQGIAKRSLDLWREMLEFGVNLYGQSPRATGGLLPYFTYGQALDEAGGLQLAARLLEMTRGT